MVGVLVVTVTVLVLTDGGGTTAVVVTVETLLVIVDDVVAEPDAAAMTPQATRLFDSPVGALAKLSALWWTISEEPELFLRSPAVIRLVVVTSFAEPSERTCSAVRSPLAGNPLWSGAW
jgi:hypothetical protein